MIYVLSYMLISVFQILKFFLANYFFDKLKVMFANGLFESDIVSHCPWMTSGASQIDQAARSKQNDMFSVIQFKSINLWFYIILFSAVFLEPFSTNLTIKVTLKE